MALVEVVFDPMKHANVSKGSLVGDKKGLLGYLIFNMPSAGAMDGEKDALKDAGNDLKSKHDLRVGSKKTTKKALEKYHRRAAVGNFGV